MNPMLPAAYIAQDRRLALARGVELPPLSYGSVLFGDISGFTPLAEALARTHGLRRGAETLTRLLNDLYAQLIGDVESQSGSVVGFSGDAITCWFAAGGASADANLGDAPRRALAAAAAMQQTVRTFAAHQPLAIKITIASGRVHRCTVGDPAIQLLDVLAGAAVDRMALGEQWAGRGETLVDEATWHARERPDAAAWAIWNEEGGARFATLVQSTRKTLTAALPLFLPEVDASAWIHPAIAPLLRDGEARFLAELRPATALFVRFGGINFETDPDAPARLDAYIRWVQRVIQGYEGLLVQLTTGDKGSYFYVAFGAPIAHGDNAARAVATALDLLNVPAALAHIGPVQVGISSGMMRIGAYGGPTRCTYGVLGDDVNVAARLMSLAAPGQILVTAAVADALGGVMVLEPLGARTVKGRAQPVAIFAVHGRSEQPAASLGRLYAEPLVGRADELAPLLAVLEGLASDGERHPGHILIIEGPAGIGKSHMAAALVQRAGALGLVVIPAACQSTARDIPFFAARQMLRALLGLPHGADAAEVQQAVERLAPAAAARAPLLAELLDITLVDSPLTDGLDARTRQGARTALVLELVEAAAQRTPLLLTLEDAHWIDEASRELFVMLASTLPLLPAALLIVQHSPEENAAGLFGGEAPAEVLYARLGDLSPAATAMLIAQRLEGPVDPLAADVIHAQAQGNPFFVEELVAALRDAGRLEADPGGWRLSPQTVTALRAAHCLTGEPDAPRLMTNAPLDVVDLGVPGSVQGVVLSRLDRLPETARLTLKVASVIGRTFALDVLQAVGPLRSRREAVQSAVEYAVARDFVRTDAAAMPNTTGGAPIYLFKHNIIRDVAYNTLLEEQQRELHLAVGEALEALHPGDIEDLAHHYHHSDTGPPAVRKRALDYLARAAARAQLDYANDTALLYYGRAAALEPRAAFLSGQVQTLHILGRRAEEHALLARLDAAPDATPAERARLWGEYYEAIGDYAQAEAALNTGLRACRGEPLGEAQCRNRLGMVAWRQGDYATAEVHFSEARTLCNEAVSGAGGAAVGETAEGARAEAANADYGMGLVYRQLGRYDEARAAFEADLAWQRSHGSRERAARARTALGHVESIAGRHAQALEAYADALAIRKAIGDKAGIGASLLAVAQAWGSLGDHPRALPRLEEALALQQSIHNRFEEWLVWNELGILHWLVGQYAEAERCLEAGMAVSRAIESDFGTAYLLCNLGQVQRDAGRPGEAAACLRAARDLALDQGDASLEATCRADLALTLVDLNAPAAALDEALQAETICNELGHADALTAVYVAQAQAYLALGDHAAALREARRGIVNLEIHGGDYFPHRDGYWCALVLQACGAAEEAQRALHAAARALHERAERISDGGMRSSYLGNIAVNRAIVDAVGGDVATGVLAHAGAHGW